MGRLSAFLLALILGGVSAVALASCGGGSDAKLLPGSTASQIESNLDQVKQLVAEGECIGAENSVAAVAGEVEELKNVDVKLKTALEEGTERLSEVVAQCQEAEEETEPSLENAVEAEELEEEELEAGEKAEKAQEKAEKQQQKEEEKAEGPESENEEGNLPPQSEGKGKAKGHEEAPPPAPAPEPPAESESGGVSPGAEVE
jgi:DNA repair exonuclease SbcCD ATPase subunit